MSRLRDIRRSALQALYQFDVSGTDRAEAVRASLDESPGNDQTHDAGFDLATMVWEFRQDADEAFKAYSNDWPTHRQPVIDRCILRLAFYEMTQTETPPKVVINEAVELAKEYSTEKSHLFINGILDKFFRTLRPGPETEASAEADAAPTTPDS